MKIKEYKIIGSRIDYVDLNSDPSAIGSMPKEDFEKCINSLIQDGWQPIGGVCIDAQNYAGLPEAFQAMVKYEEEQKHDIKEREVIDCFAIDFFNEKVADETEQNFLSKNEGWETIHRDGSSLKMVQYED